MKLLRSTVAVAALVTLASVAPASASSVPTWKNAKQVVLPKGANGIPEGYLPTLTCVSPGNCEAGGVYGVDGGVEGLIVNESHGEWTAPVTLQAPLDAAQSPSLTIYALSCGARGDCAAVGNYEDRAGTTQAFVANEVSNAWSRATKVTLPANALDVGQSALLRSVACSSPGDCSAVGDYQDNNRVASRNQGFDTDEVHGHWTRATEITTTSRVNFNPFITMNQIACASQGECVAVGSFVDENDVTQGLIESEVRGVWSRGVTLALPANASAYAGATLSEVTCVKESSCVVVGTFNTNTGAVEGLGARELHGEWSRASELTMPANASVNPHVFLYGYEGIACASAGNCSVGGQYRDGAGAYEGFLDNEVVGSWKSAVELSLPSGAESAGKNGGVIALTCPRAGNCRAGAAYVDDVGNYQALVVSEVNGAWQGGAEVVLPGGARSVGVDGGLYSLICLTTTSCTGAGSFLSNATTYQGFTLAS
jgi:hypothetical protein